jgi:hypothetical protein
MLLGRVECHPLIEIEIANVIDRQLVVEAEAVGEIEFHGGARVLEWGRVFTMDNALWREC